MMMLINFIKFCLATNTLEVRLEVARVHAKGNYDISRLFIYLFLQHFLRACFTAIVL